MMNTNGICCKNPYGYCGIGGIGVLLPPDARDDAGDGELVELKMNPPGDFTGNLRYTSPELIGSFYCGPVFIKHHSLLFPSRIWRFAG